MRSAALIAGAVVVLVAAVIVTVTALPGSAGGSADAAGSGPVTTVRTTVYVDPSSSDPAESDAIVTAPPLMGTTDALTTSVAAPTSTSNPSTDGTTGTPAHRSTPASGRGATTLSGTTTAPVTTPSAQRGGNSVTASGTPHTSAPETPSATESSHPTTSRAPTISSMPSYPDTITPAPKVSAGRIRAAVYGAVKQAAATGITESVVVLDRHTGKPIVSIDADREVPAVSIAKLLFAADELDQAGGGAHLDHDAAQDLFDMISQSDDALADDYYGYHGEGAIVQRVAQQYHLEGTHPASNPRYWGGITVTAADVASLLRQVLADPADGPYLAAPMKAATHTAADGYDQEFGMNAISGAGSKQGWGCCLGGVVAIHSAGFTSRLIVVVLSTAPPDATGINVPQVSAFENDPGFKASVAAVTATARAAVDPGG